MNWAFWSLILLAILFYEWVKSEYLIDVNSIIYWPVAYFLVLATLTPTIFYLFTRYLRSGNKFYWHILFALAFGFCHFLLSDLIILFLERLLNVEEHYSIKSIVHHWSVHWYKGLEGFVWYFAILLILLVLYYRNLHLQKQNDLVNLKNELVKAQLENYTTRLTPHFLFNAMNNISMVIRKNETARATNIMASFSSLLRRAMVKNEKIITLQEEITFLRDFIELEILSRGDNFTIEIQVPDEHKLAKIPSMLLQPLVENAFEHCAAISYNEKIKIIISIDKIDDELRLSVFNTGTGTMNWDINSTRRIGLHHTVHRLRQLYDSKFRFLVKEEKEGLRFLINIPYEE